MTLPKNPTRAAKTDRTQRGALPKNPSPVLVGKPADVSGIATGTGRSRVSGRPVPTLRNGNDEQVAAKLRELVADAESALRRILICGAFLDRVVSELPHGQLEKWLKVHCPEVSFQTVRRWRALVGRVLEACGANRSRVSGISQPLDEILALPISKVPEDARDLRAKIDELIAGKSARQLWFDFKQLEEDSTGNVSVKAGRRKGEGGRPTDAELAARNTTAEQLEEALQTARVQWLDLQDQAAEYEGFFILPDAEVRDQISALKGLIKARELWLKPTAPHDRDRLAVRKILKGL